MSSSRRPRRFHVMMLAVILPSAVVTMAAGPSQATDGSGWIRLASTDGVVTYRAIDDTGQPVPSRVLLGHENLIVDGRQVYRVIIDGAAGPRPVVPAAIPPGRGDHEQGHCAPDGSYSVQACLYVDFYLKDDGLSYYADAELYKTTWTRLDGTVVLYSGRVDAAASGRTCNGWFPLHTQSFFHSSLINGYTYYDYPSWAGTYVQLVPSATGQSATTTLTWKRGTATYNFVLGWSLIADSSWPMYNNC